MADRTADRLDIIELTARYARAVDYREIDGMDALFTPDAVVLGVEPGPIEGVEAWKAWLHRALQRFGATQHLFGNHLVDIHPDGMSATMRSSLQATHIMVSDPKEALVLTATYYDTLIRTPAGWRITEHHLEKLHTEVRRSLR
jgi:ketosteroid isomerase-like protein